MSTFLQHSSASPLINVDDVESSPIRSDMCGGRGFGLGTRNFGVLLVTGQLGRLIQHIEIHLRISVLSSDAI